VRRSTCRGVDPSGRASGIGKVPVEPRVREREVEEVLAQHFAAAQPACHLDKPLAFALARSWPYPNAKPVASRQSSPSRGAYPSSGSPQTTQSRSMLGSTAAFRASEADGPAAEGRITCGAEEAMTRGPLVGTLREPQPFGEAATQARTLSSPLRPGRRLPNGLFQRNGRGAVGRRSHRGLELHGRVVALLFCFGQAGLGVFDDTLRFEHVFSGFEQITQRVPNFFSREEQQCRA
jgi:hypothetical protein